MQTSVEAVSPLAETKGEAESDPAFNLAEMAEDLGSADLATNIDHYLYGLPKRVEQAESTKLQ